MSKNVCARCSTPQNDHKVPSRQNKKLTRTTVPAGLPGNLQIYSKTIRKLSFLLLGRRQGEASWITEGWQGSFHGIDQALPYQGPPFDSVLFFKERTVQRSLIGKHWPHIKAYSWNIKKVRLSAARFVVVRKYFEVVQVSNVFDRGVFLRGGSFEVRISISIFVSYWFRGSQFRNIRK